MTDADFEKTLSRTLHQSTVIPSHNHLAQTICFAQKEAHQRRKRERASFIQLLLSQVRFIGWKIWGLQGGLLAFISSMLESVYGQYFMENPYSMGKLLLCLSVLIAMWALPFLYRAIRFQMQEIEAATYFSSGKLLMARLVMIGIGDVLLLLGILAAAIAKASLGVGYAAFYLCFPFLLVSSVSLFLLGHLPAKQFFAGSMGLCSLVLLATITTPGQFGWLFQQSLSLGWLAVCGMLIAFGAGQCHHLLYHSPYAQLQIT